VDQVAAIRVVIKTLAGASSDVFKCCVDKNRLAPAHGNDPYHVAHFSRELEELVMAIEQFPVLILQSGKIVCGLIAPSPSLTGHPGRDQRYHEDIYP